MLPQEHGWQPQDRQPPLHDNLWLLQQQPDV